MEAQKLVKYIQYQQKKFFYIDNVNDGLFDKMEHICFDGLQYSIEEVRKLPNVFLDPFNPPDGRFIYCLMGKEKDYVKQYKEKLELICTAKVNTQFDKLITDNKSKQSLIKVMIADFKPWYHYTDKLKKGMKKVMLLLTALIFFNAANLEETNALYASTPIAIENNGPGSSKKTGLQAHQKLQKQYRYIDHKNKPWIIRWLYRK